VQADFENFRKQTIKRNTDLVERAAEGLVDKLLPALDAFDAALAHDDAKPHVRPIYDALMDILEKEGLTVVYPAGELFDPQLHEAVLHEPAGDEELEGPTVTEVLRAGYEWKGRVLRPALVRVKG
jgi:molecular chaperone GrpE